MSLGEQLVFMLEELVNGCDEDLVYEAVHLMTEFDAGEQM